MNRTQILLVEDEALIRTIVAESLIDAGYDVAQANSGEAAIQLLDGLMQLDLLVTDIQMPGLVDGNDVALAAKALHPGLPVIYVTGRPDALRNGIGERDAFIRKPFGPSEVVALIRSLLSGRQGAPPAVKDASRAATYR